MVPRAMDDGLSRFFFVVSHVQSGFRRLLQAQTASTTRLLAAPAQCGRRWITWNRRYDLNSTGRPTKLGSRPRVLRANDQGVKHNRRRRAEEASPATTESRPHGSFAIRIRQVGRFLSGQGLSFGAKHA